MLRSDRGDLGAWQHWLQEANRWMSTVAPSMKSRTLPALSAVFRSAMTRPQEPEPASTTALRWNLATASAANFVRFAAVYPIGRPRAFLVRGDLEASLGRSARAAKLWRQAFADAMRLKMPADALASLARLRTTKSGLRGRPTSSARTLWKSYSLLTTPSGAGRPSARPQPSAQAITERPWYAPHKPRVLVVVAHFDETRNPNGRPYFVPQAVGHAYLAESFIARTSRCAFTARFTAGRCAMKRCSPWPDMLVLTGVTSSFDRMRQLSAYARTKSPGCVIVAGGPVVRNLPVSSAAAFDYTCDGDIEELSEVARDCWPGGGRGSNVAALRLTDVDKPHQLCRDQPVLQFSLQLLRLTAEQRDYAVYDVGYIEAQIRSYPRKRPILFIDNNFYGNNRAFFLQKLELLKGLYEEGVLPGWLALVTSDFFSDVRNLASVREAGCLGLFCGVESFDPALNKTYNKRQNLLQPQVEMIKTCLEAGVVFQYGLIFDPAAQKLEQMQNELDFIVQCDLIPLPAFMTLTIPLLGTPHFDERVKSGHFLPLAKLRDMDGFTILTRPLDDIGRVVPFVRSLSKLSSRPGQAARRTWGFWRRYRRSLTARQMAFVSADNIRLGVPGLLGNGRTGVDTTDEPLTHITTSQPLGPLYRPAFAVPERYRECFRPTMITDSVGRLEPEIAGNLAARAGARRSRAVTGPQASESRRLLFDGCNTRLSIGFLSTARGRR